LETPGPSLMIAIVRAMSLIPPHLVLVTGKEIRQRVALTASAFGNEPTTTSKCGFGHKVKLVYYWNQ
jgi:hypothetical protein